MNHSLVLIDNAAEHPRTPWLPRCSCGGWTGRPRRHRHDAVEQYRRHLHRQRFVTRASLYKPRPPTPADRLPLELAPRTVVFT